jgi:Ca-activated chloride channel homolog
MKRQLLVTVLLAAAAQVQAQTPTPIPAPAPVPAPAPSSVSPLWSSLWRNADQRAQALLQQGDAKAAAQLFSDPRRKAYAQIQAGDYAAAASGLKALNDSEANYNRGNALAHAGDLQGALDAYDAALKQDPKHQDARHNRDLVAKALQQQKDAAKNKPQDGKSPDKPQNGSPRDNKDGSQTGQQGDQPKNQPDSGQNTKPDDKTGDKANDKSAGKHDTQQAGKPSDKPGEQGQANQGAHNPANAAAKPDATQQAANDAEQARRDVNTSQQKNAQQPTDGAGNATPLTEKQIAKEQWLRSIPDDPGGLLRRKFLIEHLMRQRDATP